MNTFYPIISIVLFRPLSDPSPAHFFLYPLFIGHLALWQAEVPEVLVLAKHAAEPGGRDGVLADERLQRYEPIQLQVVERGHELTDRLTYDGEEHRVVGQHTTDLQHQRKAIRIFRCRSYNAIKLIQSDGLSQSSTLSSSPNVIPHPQRIM